MTIGCDADADADADDDNIDWAWPSNGKLLAGFSEPANKGIDLAGRIGDPVLAAAAGKVVYSGQGLRGYAAGEVTAIIEDEASLYRALKRVRVNLPANLQTVQP